MAKEMIAKLLAGGKGSSLYALTQKLSKPAVPLGEKYSADRETSAAVQGTPRRIVRDPYRYVRPLGTERSR